MSKNLVIIAHAPSPNTQRLLDAVREGAEDDDIEGVSVRLLGAFDAGPEDVLGADALILGTTENLGYMSGALKDFFDRTYYQVLDKSDAKPFAFWVRAGHDGTGTRRAIESIAGGLRWKLVAEPLICRGTFDEAFVDQAHELGMGIAAGLEAGIF
jgi:multimeric flavodoxin WrbA